MLMSSIIKRLYYTTFFEKKQHFSKLFLIFLLQIVAFSKKSCYHINRLKILIKLVFLIIKRNC